MKKNNFGRQLLLYLVLFGVIIVMLSSLFYKDTKSTAIENYSDLAKYVAGVNEDGLVLESVYVHNTNDVTLTFTDGTQKSYKLAYVDMFYGDFQDVLLARGVVVDIARQLTVVINCCALRILVEQGRKHNNNNSKQYRI